MASSETFFKSEEAAQTYLPLEGNVLISLNTQDKPDAAELAKMFCDCGFKILSTGKTCEQIKEAGIPVELIKKEYEGRPNVNDYITNGQVQIGAGDFTFFMKKGWLIEDGHLTTPLRDMNIIGNGPQALQHISMVGNNLRIDHSAGMCGKGGQRVGVSQGLPTVLVDKLVVG